MYSDKATKFCKISTLLLSYVALVKSKVEISQNFVAFSEYMNFKRKKMTCRASWRYEPDAGPSLIFSSILDTSHHGCIQDDQISKINDFLGIENK